MWNKKKKMLKKILIGTRARARESPVSGLVSFRSAVVVAAHRSRPQIPPGRGYHNALITLKMTVIT